MDKYLPTAHAPAEPSSWPLPATGQRTVIPPSVLDSIAGHPLCEGCMPHGVGFYPQARGHRMVRDNPADYLLIYCVSGRGKLQVDGHTHGVAGGDLVLLPDKDASLVPTARRHRIAHINGIRRQVFSRKPFSGGIVSSPASTCSSADTSPQLLHAPLEFFRGLRLTMILPCPSR